MLDSDFINANGIDAIKIEVLDAVGLSVWDLSLELVDGETIEATPVNNVISVALTNNVAHGILTFGASPETRADCVILSASYLKSGSVIGSNLIQQDSDELRLLKYKVELPRGAKVTLFDDESIEAQFLSWNIPCPKSFPNMTFLQVKAANGFEQQITPSAGSQTIELYQELGRRYAVFGEIWTYSFAQTLWFADLRIQKSDYEWQDVVPTAGEGGTIVTALPQ